MSKTLRVMQVFQAELRRWAPRVERITHTTLTFTPLGAGDFKVAAAWTGGSYEKVYDKQEVFGNDTMRRSPRQKVCRFSDDLARAILQARGV